MSDGRILLHLRRVVQPRRLSRGLTLIEVLAVVAIMAVLLSVLLPVVNNAQANVDRVDCMNNQLSIGRTINLYLNDHDRVFPKARALGMPVSTRGEGTTLMVTLQRYLPPLTRVFHCPGDRGMLEVHCGISYFYSQEVSGRSEAELLVGGRGEPVGLDTVPILWDGDNHIYETNRRTLKVPSFHGPRNALFGDLHVSSVRDSSGFKM